MFGFPTNVNWGQIWMQNNIQSIFQRVRLMYGSTPLEDIIGYGVVVRALTEWTSTDQTSSIDQTSISEGIGGFITGGVNSNPNPNTVPVAPANIGPVHVRNAYIQGTDNWGGTNGLTGSVNGFGNVPNFYNPNSHSFTGPQSTRRYQINFALGLFTQDKLIPTKFMASQLAIEFTLSNAAACMIAIPQVVTGQAAPASSPAPTYNVSNVNLIPEILEFDASYGKSFYFSNRRCNVPKRIT